MYIKRERKRESIVEARILFVLQGKGIDFIE